MSEDVALKIETLFKSTAKIYAVKWDCPEVEEDFYSDKNTCRIKYYQDNDSYNLEMGNFNDYFDLELSVYTNEHGELSCVKVEAYRDGSILALALCSDINKILGE